MLSRLVAFFIIIWLSCMVAVLYVVDHKHAKAPLALPAADHFIALGIFDRSRDVVERFRAQVLPQIAPVTRWEFLVAGEPSDSACPLTYLEKLNNATYCQMDGSISISDGIQRQVYNLAGLAGVIMIMGHEFGHRIQDVTGHFPLTDDMSYSHKVENEADCFSGATLHFAFDDGAITYPFTPGFDVFVNSISSLPRAIDGHGTYPERTNAIMTGYDDGIAACLAMMR